MRVTRINLKTDAKDRNELINFCLKGRVQYVAIGWSYIYIRKKVLELIRIITML